MNKLEFSRNGTAYRLTADGKYTASTGSTEITGSWSSQSSDGKNAINLNPHQTGIEKQVVSVNYSFVFDDDKEYWNLLKVEVPAEGNDASASSLFTGQIVIDDKKDIEYKTRTGSTFFLYGSLEFSNSYKHLNVKLNNGQEAVIRGEDVLLSKNNTSHQKERDLLQFSAETTWTDESDNYGNEDAIIKLGGHISPGKDQLVFIGSMDGAGTFDITLAGDYKLVNGGIQIMTNKQGSQTLALEIGGGLSFRGATGEFGLSLGYSKGTRLSLNSEIRFDRETTDKDGLARIAGGAKFNVQDGGIDFALDLEGTFHTNEHNLLVFELEAGLHDRKLEMAFSGVLTVGENKQVTFKLAYANSQESIAIGYKGSKLETLLKVVSGNGGLSGSFMVRYTFDSADDSEPQASEPIPLVETNDALPTAVAPENAGAELPLVAAASIDDSVSENTRLEKIEDQLKLYKQYSADAQAAGDFKRVTSFQLQLMELHIEKDRINLAIHIRQNSSGKSYWNKRLKTHLAQKAQMLQKSGDGGGVTTDAQIVIHRDSKNEIEVKITDSGLRKALTDANSSKNWAEASRLTNIIKQYRKTGIWVDYKQTAVVPQIVSSIDNKLTPEQQDRLDRLPSNIRYVENQYNNEQNPIVKKKFKLQLDRLRAELNELQSASNTAGSTISPQIDTNVFIENIANDYVNTKSQDRAQKPVIKFLLDMKYPGNGKINPFDPLRGDLGLTMNPLYRLKTGELYIEQQWGSLAAFTQRSLTTQEIPLFQNIDITDKIIAFSHFIRDFIQVQGSDGTINSPMKIENLLLNDLMADEQNIEGFVSDFDNLIDQINAHQVVRDHAGNDANKFIKKFADMAHRDAIQLIPNNSHDRFAGIVLEHVAVQNNVIYSKGALQGIFGSDGAFRNLHITNNAIETAGEHTISINGMLSGSISGNTDLSGNLLDKNKITLYPLRLGGDANILIIGFDNTGVSKTDPDYYEYDDFPGVSDFRKCGRVADRIGRNPASFYTDVHMRTFLTRFRERRVHGDALSKKIALIKTLMNELVAENKARLIADPRALADDATGKCR